MVNCWRVCYFNTDLWNPSSPQYPRLWNHNIWVISLVISYSGYVPRNGSMEKNAGYPWVWVRTVVCSFNFPLNQYTTTTNQMASYCVQWFPPFLSFKPHYSCLNEASTYINIKEKQLNQPIQILVTSSYWVLMINNPKKHKSHWSSSSTTMLPGASISSPRSLQACKQEGVLPQDPAIRWWDYLATKNPSICKDVDIVW